MREFTLGAISVEAPDTFQFAFGSIPIRMEWATTAKRVRRIVASITGLNGAWDVSHTPYLDNGVYRCTFDLAAYVRASMSGNPQPFAATTNMTQGFTYYVTAYYTDNTSAMSNTYTFTAIWGSIGVGEIFNADTIHHYFGDGAGLSVYVAGATTYIRYQRSDGVGGYTTYGTTTKSNTTGIIGIPVAYQGEVADRIKIESTSTIKYRLDPDDGVVAITSSEGTPTEKLIRIIKHGGTCEGISLRWVDPQGLVRSWKFKAGQMQYAVGNDSVAVRDMETYGPANGFNYKGILCEQKEAVPRVAISYASATQEDLEILRTLLSSPIVETPNEGGYGYKRVTIATGTANHSQANYQPFTATLIYPATEVQHL